MMQARAEWRFLSMDSVRLTFSNGFASIRYDLVNRGDSLVGRVTFLSDVVDQQRPTDSVVLRRRSCSSRGAS